MYRVKFSTTARKALPSLTSSPFFQAVTSSNISIILSSVSDISISFLDVLVSPKRVVPRLADLAPGELADLMHSVQHVGSVIERVYNAAGLTIACQVRILGHDYWLLTDFDVRRMAQQRDRQSHTFTSICCRGN